MTGEKDLRRVINLGVPKAARNQRALEVRKILLEEITVEVF